MYGYINGIDFVNMECEKYWYFPKTYKGNTQEEIKQLIYSNSYIGSEKKDGCYYRFVKDEDGNCSLIARNKSVNGAATDKIKWVPHLNEFFSQLPNGTCLVGELFFPNNPGSRRVTTIMGCLSEKAIARQQKGDKLHYYIFDVYAYAGRLLFKEYNAEQRFGFISKLEESFTQSSTQYIQFAHYFSGVELWEELAKVLENGGEGIVMTKKESFVAPGCRTARKTIKVKKELNSPIDAFLTGNWKAPTRYYNGDCITTWQYWENDKTHELLCGNYYVDYEKFGILRPVTKAYYFGWAAAIEIGLVGNNGEVMPIGWISGITEEVREGIVKENEKWKHRVVVINAMDIESDTHKLRHGKIMEWREDKPWQECSYEQII